MNNRFLAILIFAQLAFVLLTACDKEDKPKAGNGFLSVALIWEDKFNSTDDITSINLWIFDKTGTLIVNNKYLSASELALQKYEILAGNVLVVIGVNVNEPIESKHTATVEDLKFELARQSALCEMTFYGNKTAEVVNGESRTAYVSLQDKPHDNTFIKGDGDINNWGDGGSDNGEILNPNK